MVQKQGYRKDSMALLETGMESKLRGNTDLHGERRHLPAYVRPWNASASFLPAALDVTHLQCARSGK